MMSYIVSRIERSDQRAYGQQCALLSKAGLASDQQADIALGIYNHDYELLATGSLSDNQLHSIAVDDCHRGKGIMNQIITYLYELRFQTGNHDLYVTVPEELEVMFKSLGFYRIKRACENMVYMGNLHAVRLNQE